LILHECVGDNGQAAEEHIADGKTIKRPSEKFRLRIDMTRADPGAR
jgi:hypothetical protein